MAWENATVREIATGSTTNDTYYTNTSSNNYYRSGDEGPFSDVTFELSFLPKDYMSYEPGDYYLVGNAQYGIFLRKTGAAGANDGSVALKASYLGEADNNGSSPSVIGSWSVKSPYSDIWRQVSILCGVNEETQKGTIISYARWSGWCGRSDDYAIIHDAYNRYNNSTIGYNVIKKIKTLSGDVSGGAGSGYIGNALLSNKKMVGYNVPTSSDESTKTESVLQASETPIAGVPKIGNGHVRITLVEQWPYPYPPELQPYVDRIASFRGFEINGTPAIELTQFRQLDNYYWVASVVATPYPCSVACKSGSFTVANQNLFEVWYLPSISLNISGSDNSFQLAITWQSGTELLDITCSPQYTSKSGKYNYFYKMYGNDGGITTFSSGNSTDLNDSAFTHSFSSLQDAIIYCSNHFRYCNLKVNGEDWIVLN